MHCTGRSNTTNTSDSLGQSPISTTDINERLGSLRLKRAEILLMGLPADPNIDAEASLNDSEEFCWKSPHQTPKTISTALKNNVVKEHTKNAKINATLSRTSSKKQDLSENKCITKQRRNKLPSAIGNALFTISGSATPFKQLSSEQIPLSVYDGDADISIRCLYGQCRNTNDTGVRKYTRYDAMSSRTDNVNHMISLGLDPDDDTDDESSTCETINGHSSDYDERDDASSKDVSLCIDASELDSKTKTLLEQEDSDSSPEDGLSFVATTFDAKDGVALDKVSILGANATKYFNKSRKTVGNNGRNNKAMEQDLDSTDEDHNQNGSILKIPIEEAREALRDADRREQKFITQLSLQFRKQFPRWMFYLSQGFNILLCGIGSKSRLLDDFCEQQLNGEYSHFVMRGYDSAFRLKEALIHLAYELGNDVTKLNAVTDIARVIKRHCSDHNDFDVILVVYNIDGPNLRDSESQLALSLLAQSHRLHMITSIDHVNASLIWDCQLLARFQFLWQECSTYRSYAREIFGSNQSVTLALNKRQRGQAHTVASLRSVWSSLTENARHILRLLVRDNGPAASSKVARTTSHKQQRSCDLNEASIQKISTTTFWD